MALALHFTTPALRGPLALLQFNDTGCCILGDCKGELCGRKVRRLASRDFSRRTAPPYFGQRDATRHPDGTEKQSCPLLGSTTARAFISSPCSGDSSLVCRYCNALFMIKLDALCCRNVLSF